MKCKFFDTDFARHAGLDINVSRMLKYVVTNQSAVISHDSLAGVVRQVRSILKTPMSEVFERIISPSNDALHNFAAINVSTRDSSLPELLTMSNVTLDLAHLPGDSTALYSMPALRDKILINLTGVIRSSSQDASGYIVSAVDVLQNLFVRGQLVATYQDERNDWIASNTTCFLFAVKSYSMILSSMIAQYYNLDIEDIQKVATILALYMDNLCGGTIQNPSTINRWDWCPPMTMRKSICSACEEYIDNRGNFSLGSVSKALANLVSMRMNGFATNSLVAICGRLGPDVITSRIALEFPPYWVYLLIASLSGHKIPLLFRMNKDRLLMRDGNEFLNNLYLNRTVLGRR